MKSRINFILTAFILLSTALIFKLFTIQVLNSDKYKVLAQDQYWDLQEIAPKRGDIISSDGYILAGTQVYYLLYAEPKNVENKYELAHNLATHFAKFYESRPTYEVETSESTSSAIVEEKDAEVLAAKTQKEITVEKKPDFNKLYERYYDILNSDRLWAVLEKEVSPEEKEEILKLNLKGIGFEEAPIRFYPEETLGAHVLGFVAHNEVGDKQGYYGIEGNFNEDLKGKPGRVMEETDALGRPILTGGYKKIPPIQGADIVLTINRSVQYMVEKHLAAGVKKYDAVSGTVVVMNPNTGEVIALANYPTYWPGNIGLEERSLEGSPHRKNIDKINLAISQTYEPGSVIKPLTVSAAIDLKLVDPNTTFEDNGPANYSGYTIDNWDGKHHQTQTITQLLQKSNNIGAAWVGTKLGSKNLSNYLNTYGLGSRTDIELEGEDTGVIRDYNSWTDIDLVTAAFGQGISATPLQVLTSFNAIANGGYLLRPKIVSTIIDNGRKIQIPVKNLGRVTKKETSETMITMLEQAVSGGEAKFFVTKEYMVSGKTGTAQIPVGGKYDPNKTNATFVGFLTNSRQFSMIVKLQEPKASIYAAETAVPLWMEIAGDLVKYYGILPDKQPEPK